MSKSKKSATGNLTTLLLIGIGVYLITRQPSVKQDLPQGPIKPLPNSGSGVGNFLRVRIPSYV